nr:PREDICTED: phospholipase A1-like [Bemisia tabaci]
MGTLAIIVGIICLYSQAFGVSAQNTDSANGNNTRCYDQLGCLDLGPPWHTPKRLVPVPGSLEDVGTDFQLFSRHFNGSVIVNQWPNVSIERNVTFNLPIVVIIHGFYASAKGDWLHELKDAYLEKRDVNVLIVDWSEGAAPPKYLLAVSNTRVVAREISRVLRYFSKQGADLSETHCIGHSLGAHICGYVAKELKAEGTLIKECTGLDAAQPGFELADESVRLHEGDAKFVVGIHTNAAPLIPFLGFGIMRQFGDVDFYFNEQVTQPGCVRNSAAEAVANITDLTDLAAVPWEFVAEHSACSHGRACLYYIEAIKGPCVFWGQRLPDIERLLTKVPVLNRLMPFANDQCTNETCIPVGFDTSRYGYRGAAFVRTNSQPNFCDPEEAKQIWSGDRFNLLSPFSS